MVESTSEANKSGDIDFKSIGRINYKTSSYIQLGKFDEEDFLLIAEFSPFFWNDGTVAIVPGIKDAVKNGDVTSLEAHTLDTSPYRLQSPNRA